jgi:hypothetical protein
MRRFLFLTPTSTSSDCPPARRAGEADFGSRAPRLPQLCRSIEASRRKHGLAHRQRAQTAARQGRNVSVTSITGLPKREANVAVVAAALQLLVTLELVPKQEAEEGLSLAGRVGAMLTRLILRVG